MFEPPQGVTRRELAITAGAAALAAASVGNPAVAATGPRIGKIEAKL